MSDIWRSLKYGIINLIKWTPTIWKDRDWDHSYFHIIIHKKLSNMEKYLRKYGHHVDAEKDADNIKICLNLLNRILKNEYHEMVYKDHDKKWGESHFNWTDLEHKPGYKELHITRDNAITEKEKEQEIKEYRALMLREGEMAKQDIDYLYDIIKKYILHWWD